ncbi:hypothetical protein TNIN_332071 [Trichonephila inaurata madagascariensis]|uniref:Uncharacterized protein n=1 Tax=Trichonephila inaurata madagascariensis TaxID=2747483 RepID=A0A8X7C8V4_9ARAC|nr:hypothetical protein TNIN_332071 [Trichonephila inaurata madagascariensis]
MRMDDMWCDYHFHSPPSKLGDSREGQAIRRFNSLEHSQNQKKPAIYSQYRNFYGGIFNFRAYGACSKHDYASKGAYYLPHHAVLRDSVQRQNYELSSVHQPNQQQGILLMIY